MMRKCFLLLWGVMLLQQVTARRSQDDDDLETSKLLNLIEKVLGKKHDKRGTSEISCGSSTTTSSTGVLTSKNFGSGLYPASSNCEQSLESQDKSKVIKISFTDFDLEGGAGCKYDYLAIYDGSSTAAPILMKKCGSSMPSDVTSTGNTVYFKFKSDYSGQRPGFRLQYTFEDGAAQNTGSTNDENNSNTAQSSAESATQDFGCDFESDTCGWSNDAQDDIQWVRRAASNPHVLKPYLPSVDASEGTQHGKYMMAESTYSKTGDIGRIVSSQQPPTPATGRCMRFAYFMNFDRMGDVKVKLQIGNNAETVLWSRSWGHGAKWYQGMVTIKSNQNHRIVIELTVDLPYASTVIIDAITIAEEACVAVPPNCGTSSDKRIMNGVISEKGQWPWTVQLKTLRSDGTSNQCGGSLIHPQWIISAAHCFEYKGTITNDVIVYFGEANMDDLEDSNFRVRAEQVIIHPDRASTGIAPNDVALVKLPYPVHLTESVNTICLPETNSNVFSDGHECTAIGWGSDKNGQVTKDLYHIHEKLMTDESCASFFDQGIVTTDMLCTWPTLPASDQSICPGDSGGPLACENDGQYTLMGVSSWIVSCNQQLSDDITSPTVFAKVPHFYSWIEETIADNTETPLN